MNTMLITSNIRIKILHLEYMVLLSSLRGTYMKESCVFVPLVIPIMFCPCLHLRSFCANKRPTSACNLLISATFCGPSSSCNLFNTSVFCLIILSTSIFLFLSTYSRKYYIQLAQTSFPIEFVEGLKLHHSLSIIFPQSSSLIHEVSNLNNLHLFHLTNNSFKNRA